MKSDWGVDDLIFRIQILAGRTFKLKELEDLCTKFLQYRIDARNLIHLLKNTIKYDTPDLRDVVVARLLKDADKAFDNEQMLDLSEEEIMNIMSRRPFQDLLALNRPFLFLNQSNFPKRHHG